MGVLISAEFEHKVKSNKRKGQNKRGVIGNFEKIKRKGLFVNEIQVYH